MGDFFFFRENVMRWSVIRYFCPTWCFFLSDFIHLTQCFFCPVWGFLCPIRSSFAHLEASSTHAGASSSQPGVSFARPWGSCAQPCASFAQFASSPQLGSSFTQPGSYSTQSGASQQAFSQASCTKHRVLSTNLQTYFAQSPASSATLRILLTSLGLLTPTLRFSFTHPQAPSSQPGIFPEHLRASSTHSFCPTWGFPQPSPVLLLPSPVLLSPNLLLPPSNLRLFPHDVGLLPPTYE